MGTIGTAAERERRSGTSAGTVAAVAPARYRADIDGLRAIAVLAVLGFHAFPRQIPGGFVGVDVFFVISGFLITGILLSGSERGTLRLRDFYARRVLRIFPALIALLLACWLFGWFVLFPDEYAQLGRHVAGGAEFVANIFFWREAGYFDNLAETKPLLHLWSLGIEEQFYIVWPLLLYAMRKFRRGLLIFLPALAVVSFAVNVVGVERYPTATFYSPASRAWELAIGGLLAALAAGRVDPLAGLRHFVRRPWEASGSERETTGSANGAREAGLLSGVGLGFVAFSVALAPQEGGFPGWWALLPTVGTALVLAAGGGAWFNRVLLSWRPLVWIGLISYPLYLWHWPLLSFARIVESKTPAVGYRVVALALSFLLAAATYYLVERPLRFGRPIRRRVVVLAAGMAAMALAGQITASQDGMPGRAAVRRDLVLERDLARPDDEGQAAECRRRLGFESAWQFCLIDRLDAPPTVALVGDSHGHHLFAGFSEAYREQGDNLVYLETHLPFWGVPNPRGRRDEFQPYSEGMLDFALESKSVHTVILATVMKLKPQTPAGRSMIGKMSRTIERFVKAGKRVIVVKDVPRLNFDPRECVDRPLVPGFVPRAPCAIRRDFFEKKTAAHERALHGILARFPAVETFEPAHYLCDETYCWAILDGKLLYRDTNHLSRDGDLLVGEMFRAERRSAGERGRAPGARSAAKGGGEVTSGR